MESDDELPELQFPERYYQLFCELDQFAQELEPNSDRIKEIVFELRRIRGTVARVDRTDQAQDQDVFPCVRG